jgi:hypothetical protein
MDKGNLLSLPSGTWDLFLNVTIPWSEEFQR